MRRATNNLQHLILFLIGAALAFSARAEDVQSLESIRLTTRHFLDSQVNDRADAKYRIDVGRLDARLRLARCGKPLEAFMPLGGQIPGRTTVGIRCPAQPGWTIYVPARVKLFGRVLIARHALPRGVEIPASAVMLEERELSTLSQGYLTDSRTLAGKIPKRPIGAGMALTPGTLELKKLVKRGDRVSIVAKRGGIEVTMFGQAMADGAAGERIPVRNLSSKRKIEGVVLKEGVIKMTF